MFCRLTSSIIVMLFFSISFTNAESWKALTDSMKYYKEKQAYETALVWALKVVPQAENEFGKLDTNYYWAFDDLGEIYSELGKSDSALHYWDISLKIIKDIFKGDHQYTATNLTKIAYEYQKKGERETAKNLFNEALEMYKRYFGKDNLNIANCSNNLAGVYASEGNFTEAEKLYKESIEMKRRLFRNGHSDLVVGLSNFAYLYLYNGKTSEAEPLFSEALDMAKKISPGDNRLIAYPLNGLANCYVESGKLDLAESLRLEALDINRKLYSGSHPATANSLNRLGDLYKNLGRFDEAENLFKEALAMNRELFGEEHDATLSTLNNLAILYNLQGRLPEMEAIAKEMISVSKKLYREDEENLALLYNNVGEFYGALGRNDEASSLYKQGLEIYRKLYKGDYPETAMILRNLGGLNQTMGNLDEAEKYLKEAVEMDRRLYKEDSPSLAAVLNSLAWLYLSEGKLKEAEALYTEGTEMYRRIFRGDNVDVAASTYNLAFCYQKMGKFAESEKLSKEALEMNRRIFKSENIRLVYALMDIVALYLAQGKNSEAEKPFKEALDMQKSLFYKNSTNLSEKEKEKYWKGMSSFFESYLSFSVDRMRENPSILSSTLDNLLFTKAILFNSTNKIKKRILASGDTALVSSYKKFISLKDMLLKYYSMPQAQLSKLNINLDSLEKKANELEKEISYKSEIYKQSYENKKVTWKTIQAVLKPDEAAVEVARFRLMKKGGITDTIYYAFLIVSDQTEEYPEIVLLKNGKSLENEFYNDYRTFIKDKQNDNLSFDRYWGELYKKLKNYKKIYFSADGIYNKLNPSTLLMPDGKVLLEIQDIQQLNSTKDLLLGYYQTRQESNIFNSALLIGNPNFSLTESEVTSASRKIRGEKSGLKSNETLANLRGIELTKLPGTEKEIGDIEKFLKNMNWVVNSYVGDMALKTAVKNAKNPRILHIATHGLFLEDVKKGGKELFGFEEQKMLENPLLRSGLFFTGADNYLKTDKPSYSSEDNGILTAYEAMNLDLDRTELVVLSACETGLGEIQNGEGVFGLRRAFQQAGAKTILMSLWKVNDEATQLLMTAFYSNWVQGITKRDAFAKAQQTVRNKFPEPYYWGAFVMVGE